MSGCDCCHSGLLKLVEHVNQLSAGKLQLPYKQLETTGERTWYGVPKQRYVDAFAEFLVEPWMLEKAFTFLGAAPHRVSMMPYEDCSSQADFLLRVIRMGMFIPLLVELNGRKVDVDLDTLELVEAKS